MELSLALALATIALILILFFVAGYILAASEEVYQSLIGEDRR
jgi:ABC-type molybdate transport system permease subunit